MAMRVVLTVVVVLISAVVVGALVFFVMTTFMRLWRLAQGKGYTGPITPVVLMTACVTGFVGGMFVAAVTVPDGGVGGTVVAVALMVVATLAGPGLIVLLLPARPVRSGRRRRPRTPFRLLGNVAVAIPTLIIVVLLVNGQPTKIGGQLMLPMAFVAVLCESAARRADRIDARPPVDPRPAVVWIRGFGNERRLFGFRRRDEQEVRGRPELRKVFGRRREPMSFEEFFAPAIAGELGRGYGLGNPRDYLPPDGIDRHYATDDSWREQFAELVAGARCVIMAPGDWPELRYEFRVIRKLGAHRRLFVFTPPAYRARSTWLGNRVKGYREETWEDFRVALGDRAGYRLGRDPGPGAVVTFKKDGRAVVLAYDAEEPSDYIAAVQRHLADIETPRPPEVTSA